MLLIWGSFGISYLELLLMFEVFAGHRLLTEETVRPQRRPCRPLFFGFFSSYRARDPTWLSVSFIAFSGLWVISRGGLARFIPCQPSAHFARLSQFRLGTVWSWSLLPST